MDVFWKCEANLRKCVFYLFLVLRVAFRVILPVAIREFYFANRTMFKFVSGISRISKFPIAKSHSRYETYSITIFLIADLILWNNEP